MSVLKAIWKGWMAFADFLGTVVFSIVFTILYIVLLPPFALIRLSDPLRKKLGAASYWEDHTPHEPTLERTARPF